MICGDLNADATFVLPSFYAEHGIISTVDVVINKKDGASATACWKSTAPYSMTMTSMTSPF